VSAERTKRRTTLVKKITADGQPCRKCVDVLDRLERDGLMDAIDRVVVADERDPDGEGFRLAARLGVSRAPFFVVECPQGGERVFTVYFQFRKAMLRDEPCDREPLAGMFGGQPDLDFV